MQLRLLGDGLVSLEHSLYDVFRYSLVDVKFNVLFQKIDASFTVGFVAAVWILMILITPTTIRSTE